jgi:hypothetical protein
VAQDVAAADIADHQVRLQVYGNKCACMVLDIKMSLECFRKPRRSVIHSVWSSTRPTAAYTYRRTIVVNH